jgi:aspartyl/glutamyl-tRNA(Asn/Gln) amidotransferase C subunit
MAEITIADVENLARLSRLELSDTEKEKLQKDLSAIIGYFDELKSAPSAGELAETHQLQNVMRPDDNAYTPGEYTEDLLKVAPARHENYLAVKKIM